MNMLTLENIEVLEKNEVMAVGCCGGAPTNNEDACCKLDEEKKAVGEEGCGCNATRPLTIRANSPRDILRSQHWKILFKITSGREIQQRKLRRS